MENKEKNFEEILKELDEAVSALENNDLALEEAIETYKKGMELSLQAKKKLEEAKAVLITQLESK